MSRFRKGTSLSRAYIAGKSRMTVFFTHLPPDFVKQHLNISQEVLDAIPPGNYAVLPR